MGADDDSSLAEVRAPGKGRIPLGGGQKHGQYADSLE